MIESGHHSSLLLSAPLEQSFTPPSEIQLLLEIRNKMDEMNTYLQQNNSVLKSISMSYEKTRKLMSKMINRFPQHLSQSETEASPSNVDGSEESTANLTSAPSVLYEGKDIVRLGRGNLSMMTYAAKLARHLWTDEELSNYRLLPIRGKGRLSLSEDKTDLWVKAMKARFSIDDKDLRPAIVAINQLGIDLRSGKRRRVD